MRTGFSSTVIAATALWTGALAQLDRECFYLTDMHGPYNEDSELMSNLPTLMAMYKPGMRLESITALQDKEDGDKLSGLQMNLSLKGSRPLQELKLPMVGADLEAWDSQRLVLKNQQPDRLSILEDERTGGICDVVIYRGKQATHLSKDNSECLAELKGITETQVRLTEKAPLVGFHGMADEVGLTSLGMIFVDTENKNCQKALDLGGMDLYEGFDMQDIDQVVEDSVTPEEHERAVALEAILAYDSMMKARETKQQIAQQIHELNVKHPIRTTPTKPASSKDLAELFDRLEKLDMEGNASNKEELRQIFDKLAAHYDGYNRTGAKIYELPVKVGQIRKVYMELTELDGGNDKAAFSGRKDNQSADVIDLVNLLDKLSQHYTTGGYGQEPLELGSTRIDSLIDLFDTLAEFYAFDSDLKDEPEYMEMADIYDELAEIFGKPSDYALEEPEIDQMYEKMMQGEEMQQAFEGQMIENFDELLDIELEENDERIEELVSRMKHMEEVEAESRNFFRNEYKMQNKEIESMMKTLEHETINVEKLQHMIRENAEEDKKEAEEAAKKAAEPQKFAESNITQESVNETVVHKVDVAVESMIYTFMGVLVAAVIIGVAVGGVCLLCCMRCYQRGQKKRLAQAQKDFAINAPKINTISLDSENEAGQVQQTKVLSKLDTEDLEAANRKAKASQDIEQRVVTTENDAEDDITNQATDRKFSTPLQKAQVSRLNLTEIKKDKLQETEF